MAAGQAAKAGAKVILLEKMSRPGRKLRITGKGRCNLTNIAPVNDFICHFGPGGKFLRQAFARFFSEDLIDFLNSLGVKTKSERGGRVFPASEKAEEVVDALAAWVIRCGVELRGRTRVDSLVIENGKITGVTTSTIAPGSDWKKGVTLPVDTILIATGGASYPATGSTGDGYRLAEQAGHTIEPIRPSLVPLETFGDVAAQLQGLSLRNVKVRLIIDEHPSASAFGEMLFTHFGLSGPVILSLSGQVVDALKEKRKVVVSIDLKPALDDNALNARLLRDFESHSNQKFKTVLNGLLPQKLIPVCISLVGIDADKPAHQITSVERKRLRLWLKDFQFEVAGHRTFDEAIITAGGVSTKEIDPRTMQSRLIQGLYLAGHRRVQSTGSFLNRVAGRTLGRKFRIIKRRHDQSRTAE
jgi:predicted Rossmann fold flavoprotein